MVTTHIINKILLRSFSARAVLFSSEVSRSYILDRVKFALLVAFDAREEEDCLDTCS